MGANEVKEGLKSIINSADASPVYMGGAPGTGKLFLCKETAREEGIDFIELVVGQHLGDLNMEDKDLLSLLPKKGRGLLIIDIGPTYYILPDRNRSAPLIYKLMHLSINKKLGDYKLPTDWRIILMGPAFRNANFQKEFLPILNRCVPLGINFNS